MVTVLIDPIPRAAPASYYFAKAPCLVFECWLRVRLVIDLQADGALTIGNRGGVPVCRNGPRPGNTTNVLLHPANL
jgi:hypothetical protein